MTNEANADPQGETQSGNGPQGETPTTQPGETPGSATTETTSSDDVQKELDRLKAALKRANSEAKEYRVKADELDGIKAAKLSNEEKLQKQLATLQAEKEQGALQLQEERVSNAIQRQALQLGIDPKLAMRLIDRSSLDYD